MKVDFKNNENDWKVCVLAVLGFSDYAISTETDLSLGQVSYRIQKANLQYARYNYRNGLTNVSERLADLGLSKQESNEIWRAINGKKKGSKA